MEIVQLRNFIEVADRGSFTRAALALGLNQPALSRQIRRLELELHRNLLHRHGRGVVLTDAGERFASVARDVLHQLDTAAQGGLESDSGRIVVGVPPSFGRMLAVRLARAFAARFSPARLTIVEDRSSNLRSRVRDGGVDLALLHLPEACDDLTYEAIADESICLISPKQSADPLPDTITLAEVAQLPLIFPNARNPVREVTARAAALAGLELDVTQEIGATDTILELVQNGYGYAVATKVILQGTRYIKTLRVQQIVDPDLSIRLTLASRQDEAPMPLQAKATRLIKEVLTHTFAIG
ncbi:LysR family transcriptional regulator [Paraburkholderia sp. ZP32-5]|uniref:LysR family transcriptional regulator n=1 Tax=Paraburkholderia sp. ZP32-5 TaxID=2883245 RepID=UPI001F2ADD81|nr:LysR family transcriptional regulator [Paraburkholderia sp. ZP32-5]